MFCSSQPTWTSQQQACQEGQNCQACTCAQLPATAHGDVSCSVSPIGALFITPALHTKAMLHLAQSTALSKHSGIAGCSAPLQCRCTVVELSGQSQLDQAYAT